MFLKPRELPVTNLSSGCVAGFQLPEDNKLNNLQSPCHGVLANGITPGKPACRLRARREEEQEMRNGFSTGLCAAANVPLNPHIRSNDL